MPNSILEKYHSMEYGPAPEDPKESLAWLDAHSRSFGHFINGAFTTPTATFLAKNPATGEALAQISSASKTEVDAAVQAARAALPGWQALTGHQRARFLYAFARQVQKHSRRLAVLETLDNGKSIRESRDIDIPLVARHFYYHGRLGAAPGPRHDRTSNRIPRLPARRRRRPDHPLELPPADVRLEGRSRTCRRQHHRH